MPSKRPSLKSTSSSKDFKIKNKHRRTSHNVNVRSTAAKAKRQARFDRKKEEALDPNLRRERLKKNVPQTLDMKRVAVDKPWVPSEELLERARKSIEDTEGKVDDEDEEMEESDRGSKSEDEKDSLLLDDDDASDDLGSLRDSDSGSEDEPEVEVTSKSSKPSKPSKQTAEETETLNALLHLIPITTTPPKPLLTTTRMARRHDLYQTLSLTFPNTTYIPRGNRFTIPQIAKFATNREYTHLIVALEDSKNLHGLVIILLPAGPTFHFSLTSYSDGKAIEGRGVNTDHVPELILNNFTTSIGRLTAGLFQSLYPAQPDFKGRQVVTLHNQRDYIFFRMHRYVFKDTDVHGKRGSGDRTTGSVANQKAGEDLGIRVGLQELGPRFTLKLRRVERGVCTGVEWEWKGRMEKNRKMFHL